MECDAVHFAVTRPASLKIRFFGTDYLKETSGFSSDSTSRPVGYVCASMIIRSKSGVRQLFFSDMRPQRADAVFSPFTAISTTFAPSYSTTRSHIGQHFSELYYVLTSLIPCPPDSTQKKTSSSLPPRAKPSAYGISLGYVKNTPHSTSSLSSISGPGVPPVGIFGRRSIRDVRYVFHG